MGDEGDGRAFRETQASLDQRRDPEAPHARDQGHGIEGNRQGADAQRGIDQGAREGRWAGDREIAVRLSALQDAPANSRLTRSRLATAITSGRCGLTDPHLQHSCCRRPDGTLSNAAE